MQGGILIRVNTALRFRRFALLQVPSSGIAFQRGALSRPSITRSLPMEESSECPDPRAWLGREPSPQEDLSEPLQLVNHQPVCSCGRIDPACAPCVSVRTSDFVSIRALLFGYTLGVTLSERCGYTQTYSTGFWCVL